MSCGKKNINIERYHNPHRSHFDQIMMKVYNPDNQYHAAPYPMDRTDFDMRLIKQWSTCPKCGHGFTDMNPSKGPYGPLNGASSCGTPVNPTMSYATGYPVGRY